MSSMAPPLTRIEKPWGHEEWWAFTDKYVGKILHIKSGHRLSLQYHRVKDESIRVLDGTLTLILDHETLTLQPGDGARITPGTLHRMEARDGDVKVVEVSTPEVDDVIRISDDYLRKSVPDGA